MFSWRSVWLLGELQSAMTVKDCFNGLTARPLHCRPCGLAALPAAPAAAGSERSQRDVSVRWRQQVGAGDSAGHQPGLIKTH